MEEHTMGTTPYQFETNPNKDTGWMITCRTVWEAVASVASNMGLTRRIAGQEELLRQI